MGCCRLLQRYLAEKSRSIVSHKQDLGSWRFSVGFRCINTSDKYIERCYIYRYGNPCPDTMAPWIIPPRATIAFCFKRII